MPYGNGAPLGLPSQPLAVLQDPGIVYDAAYQSNTVAYGGLAKPSYGRSLSPYAQVILSTPGLVDWWRFDKYISSYGTLGSFLSVTSAQSLSPVLNGGSFTVVPGLIPCDESKAVKLAGGCTLRSQDYFKNIYAGGNSGLWAVEWWMKLDSTVSDSAYVGTWRAASGGQGWMIYANSGTDLAMYVGTTSNTPAGTTGIISAGKLYHVVANFTDYQDYPSQIFVNGVLVGTIARNTLSGMAFNSVSQFEIGSYSDSAGGKALGTFDEFAIYSRSLQPAEVRQHYRAAFTRSV